MGRIRTIKPEFPQSESMGRVSRDARLFFILMWGLADDSGRLRGNSRMLASLLCPYDDDAGALAEGWLSELASEDCIIRYEVDQQAYIEICKWLNHQKIDKPSPSKIPPFAESSPNPRRILAKNSLGMEGNGMEWNREQGTGNREQGEDSLRFAPGTPSASLRVTPSANAPSDPKKNRAKKPKPEKPPPKTGATWSAYATAFQTRYGVAPVRNAKVNSQLGQLVDRLGETEAPLVAAFYVGHQKSMYAGRRHSVDLLLNDAEAIRTDWATGRQSTATLALMGDKTQTTYDVFAPLIAAAKAKEAREALEAEEKINGAV